MFTRADGEITLYLCITLVVTLFILCCASVEITRTITKGYVETQTTWTIKELP